MKEGLQNIGTFLFVLAGSWLIVGTFTFHIVPAWYVVLHMICVLLFIGFAPVITEKILKSKECYD